MNKEKYLYGASVQGIQSFIFNTNKLAEIVGASELVENICTKLFKDSCSSFKDENLIIGAAGNIKYIFDTKDECEKTVLLFPKTVMDAATGITISQAVIKVEETTKLSDAIDNLEIKLKTQRNKITIPTEIGFMGIERSRRTGGVGVDYQKNEVIDAATNAKLEAKDSISLFKKIIGENGKINNKLFPFDIEDITESGNNSWIAVIHADGNGVGNILQNMGNKLKETSDNTKIQQAFSTFSKALDSATKSAIQTAFRQVVEPDFIQAKAKRYAIRPIIIGGDDVTVIIRADLALAFTEKFLLAFETESAKAFSFLKSIGVNGFENGITACAGIAYVKQSYPFHYAVHLAEALCKDAKKMVKTEGGPTKNGEIPQSSIAFYKVQETFVEDLETMKARTMKAGNVDFYFGPYLLNQEAEFASITELNYKLKEIETEAASKNKSKAAGKLRQIVSELYKDQITALFMLDRMKEVNSDFYKKLKLDKEKSRITSDKSKSILNDVIQLHGFNYGNNAN